MTNSRVNQRVRMSIDAANCFSGPGVGGRCTCLVPSCAEAVPDRFRIGLPGGPRVYSLVAIADRLGGEQRGFDRRADAFAALRIGEPGRVADQQRAVGDQRPRRVAGRAGRRGRAAACARCPAPARRRAPWRRGSARGARRARAARAGRCRRSASRPCAPPRRSRRGRGRSRAAACRRAPASAPPARGVMRTSNSCAPTTASPRPRSAPSARATGQKCPPAPMTSGVRSAPLTIQSPPVARERLERACRCAARRRCAQAGSGRTRSAGCA